MYRLIKDYFFESEERYWALLRLLGVILGVVASVALTSMLAAWTVGFWAALTEMSYPLYMASLQNLLLLTISYVSVYIFNDYLVGTLAISWREWLTKKLINKYASESENNYLEIDRHPSQINNPAQRIQEDVPYFVDTTLKLGTELLQSMLILVTFMGNLWVIGGSATFMILGMSITIPGYLVWAAILFATTSNLLTYLIGKTLVNLSGTQQNLEVDLRKDIDLLSDNAESVAQDKGEDYFRRSFLGKLQSVCSNAYQILRVKVRLSAFNNFYQQISLVFPYIAAAPLYFARQTTLGELMEVGFSFGQIQSALYWFSNSYEDLASYTATIERIVVLEDAMSESGLNTTPRSIVVHERRNAAKLCVRNLNLAEPNNPHAILNELNLTFRAGENTLLKGRSGLGKSTLFKALANVWKYGEGEVFISNLSSMYFLPQRPVIPTNTLKAILAYPELENIYSDDEYETVLRLVGMDAFIGDLNTHETWSKKLSAGQQQRISFARALLKKPDWLFLDEATSSLDEDSEYDMYNLLKEQLSTTTFISIAHRSSVEKHHDRVVTFYADDQRKIRQNDTHAFFKHEKPTAANDENTLGFANNFSTHPG